MTDGIRSLIFIAYGYAASFLEWAASDINTYFSIPVLCVLLIGSWIVVFLVWLVERALQPKEDSIMARLFSNMWRLLFVVCTLFITALLLAIFMVSEYQNDTQAVIEWVRKYLAVPALITIAILAALNLIAGWFAVRYWLPTINHWVNESLTKKGYQQSGFSDVRKIGNFIPKTQDYDPTKYWKLKNEQIFIGLDSANSPVYISLSEWRSQHQQVAGTTGFGKGVAVSNQLSQCLAMGQTVVVFDPKDDEWAPSVLLDVAERYRRPTAVIDLNIDKPQFNPLYGADERQMFDLFVGSFGLAEGRGDSDFYRTYERRVVRQWKEGLALGQSLTQLAAALTEEDFEKAPKLCNELTELVMLGCINTCQKGAWYDVLEQGGLVYVIGSIRNEPVLRLQKMLLLRLMQRLEQRDRNKPHTHVTIFLDELKYLLCKPSLQALGTIRDKFANVILTHQSIADLRDVPDELDPEAVKSAVLENTSLKLFYRSQDPNTVEWIAKRSGTIPAHREMLDQSRNEGFSEITGAERRLLETERYLIDQNTILSLPKRCGVWFSNEPAQIVLTSPVKTRKRTICPSLVDPSQEPDLEQIEQENTVLEIFS